MARQAADVCGLKALLQQERVQTNPGKEVLTSMDGCSLWLQSVTVAPLVLVCADLDRLKALMEQEVGSRQGAKDDLPQLWAAKLEAMEVQLQGQVKVLASEMKAATESGAEVKTQEQLRQNHAELKQQLQHFSDACLAAVTQPREARSQQHTDVVAKPALHQCAAAAQEAEKHERMVLAEHALQVAEQVPAAADMPGRQNAQLAATQRAAATAQTATQISKMVAAVMEPLREQVESLTNRLAEAEPNLARSSEARHMHARRPVAAQVALPSEALQQEVAAQVAAATWPLREQGQLAEAQAKIASLSEACLGAQQPTPEHPDTVDKIKTLEAAVAHFWGDAASRRDAAAVAEKRVAAGTEALEREVAAQIKTSKHQAEDIHILQGQITDVWQGLDSRLAAVEADCERWREDEFDEEELQEELPEDEIEDYHKEDGARTEGTVSEEEPQDGNHPQQDGGAMGYHAPHSEDPAAGAGSGAAGSASRAEEAGLPEMAKAIHKAEQAASQQMAREVAMKQGTMQRMAHMPSQANLDEASLQQTMLESHPGKHSRRMALARPCRPSRRRCHHRR
eukprot:jgi/Astpho2/6750/fgenesh1_pg.00102_%23_28_t